MYRDEKLEMKVGLFMGLGLFVMFLIVFFVKDISFMGDGYEFDIVFSFINGVKTSSPVRLAGVDVGEVKKTDLYYDAAKGKTQVKLRLWIKNGTRIEKDADFRVNTLGLLGERYVEVSPGVSKDFIEAGDTVNGKDPLNIGEQMEKMNGVIISMSEIISHIQKGEGSLGKMIMDDSFYRKMDSIADRLEKGEGTIGKLLKDDGLYNDLRAVVGKIKDGEGTIGKLLTDDKLYNDVDAMILEIKANPWKLLHKTKEPDKAKPDVTEKTASRGRNFAK
jgi:phospholipid/cholesterol/gamma-HCH transport system substrate-binding protein